MAIMGEEYSVHEYGQVGIRRGLPAAIGHALGMALSGRDALIATDNWREVFDALVAAAAAAHIDCERVSRTEGEVLLASGGRVYVRRWEPAERCSLGRRFGLLVFDRGGEEQVRARLLMRLRPPRKTLADTAVGGPQSRERAANDGEQAPTWGGSARVEMMAAAGWKFFRCGRKDSPHAKARAAHMMGTGWMEAPEDARCSGYSDGADGLYLCYPPSPARAATIPAGTFKTDDAIRITYTFGAAPVRETPFRMAWLGDGPLPPETRLATEEDYEEDYEEDDEDLDDEECAILSECDGSCGCPNCGARAGRLAQGGVTDPREDEAEGIDAAPDMTPATVLARRSKPAPRVVVDNGWDDA